MHAQNFVQLLVISLCYLNRINFLIFLNRIISLFLVFSSHPVIPNHPPPFLSSITLSHPTLTMIVTISFSKMNDFAGYIIFSFENLKKVIKIKRNTLISHIIHQLPDHLSFAIATTAKCQHLCYYCEAPEFHRK